MDNGVCRPAPGLPGSANNSQLDNTFTIKSFHTLQCKSKTATSSKCCEDPSNWANGGKQLVNMSQLANKDGAEVTDCSHTETGHLHTLAFPNQVGLSYNYDI